MHGSLRSAVFKTMIASTKDSNSETASSSGSSWLAAWAPLTNAFQGVLATTSPKHSELEKNTLNDADSCSQQNAPLIESNSLFNPVNIPNNSLALDSVSVVDGRTQNSTNDNESEKIERERQRELDIKHKQVMNDLGLVALGSDCQIIQSLISQSVNEDVIVDKLLSQFPTYGTSNSSPNNAGSNPHADFWLGPFAAKRAIVSNKKTSMAHNDEYDDENDMIENDMLMQDNDQDVNDIDIADLDPVAREYFQNNVDEKARKTELNAKNGKVKPNSAWDEDEQNLWKASPFPSDDQQCSGRQNSGVGTNIDSSALIRRQGYRNIRDLPHSYQKKSSIRSSFANANAVQINDSNHENHEQQGTTDQPDVTNRVDASIISTPSLKIDLIMRNKTSNLDERQFWMPDQLCKICYACETPFTVFRRRHHCRLCGQVFCNTCSAFFLPSLNQYGTVDILPAAASLQADTTTMNTATVKKTLPALSTRDSVVSTCSVRVCKMCFDQVSASANELPPPIPVEVNAKKSLTTTTPKPSEQNSSSLITSHNPLSTGKNSDFNTSLEKSVVITISTNESQIPLSLDERMKARTLTQNNGFHGPLSLELTEQRESDNVKSQLNSEKHLIEEGNSHLGMTAARHLEAVARELLRLHAPLIWDHYEHDIDKHKQTINAWINKLLSLATRCCATVNPNVKKGDLLDVRPYVKVKVISGSSYRDCQYLSGILFRNNVTHKRMAKELENPKIMLLSGGIEFSRAGTETRMASLETLFEQEDTYLEILVGKILKLQPSILLIGRSASRRAQELLLKAGVILVQQVKSSLLSRISRQTGAVVISSTDHVMNRFGVNVLGTCRRFRLVTFRDNEVWTDSDIISKHDTLTTPSALDFSLEGSGGDPIAHPGTVKSESEKSAQSLKLGVQKSIKALLADSALSNHERQAALAASQLGESFIDGSEAVKSGLAKRGVTETFVMLEGCPKHLGCTIVLRGASLAALKQLKIVFRFLANVSYNLKLETCYFRERGARIRPDFQEISKRHTYSSSLCIDYGTSSRPIRPWNGGSSNNDTALVVPRPQSGEVTAFDHQSILITSVWMTEKNQCCPAEVKGICYYSQQDVSLGQFLRDSCFNLSLKCQNPNCKKSVLDHTLSFVHNDGLINISVEEMEERLPPSPLEAPRDDSHNNQTEEDDEDNPIATWTYCQICKKVVTPLVYMSENTWKWSFGKFLEVFFYNRDAVLNAPSFQCSCQLQTAATLYYGCGKLAARFTYERLTPFGVFVRRFLPIDITYHKNGAVHHLGVISVASAELFVKFYKHIEKISRDARNLFNSAMNRPEHLQTVLSELNRMGSEVDHVSRTLQEKISSFTDNCRKHDDGSFTEALLRFPWFARRYLFNLTSAWNEKLRYAGQAISAMKKIAESAARNEIVGLGPNVTANVGDPYNEELTEAMKRLRQLIDHYANLNVTDITQVLPSFPGTGDVVNEAEFDDEFDDPESTIDFADGIDADVLASRRRLQSKGVVTSVEKSKTFDQRPSKALGTRRSLTDQPRLNPTINSIEASSSLASNSPPRNISGGAVKSAITRFFNRGGRDYDHYLVQLGIFAEGRPRLAPGVNGIVIPVRDDQLSTIIAYSLASGEYSKQFKQYSRMDGVDLDLENSVIERSRKKDLDAGIENHEVRDRIFDDRPNSSATPQSPSSQHNRGTASVSADDSRDCERKMLIRNKAHIKHTFRDIDDKGYVTCKFVCTTYWATQFHAVRQVFLGPSLSTGGISSKNSDDEQYESFSPSQHDIELGYIESLSSAEAWAASGGKSGASFARTSDDRFVIKCISRTELQMFLDCAPAYFEYITKAFFHGLPTVLCKIVGVYQIGVHNKITGKRSMEQVAVMQNIFYKRRITKIFDLKGSLRGRFAAQKEEISLETPSRNKKRANGKRSDDRFQTENSSGEGSQGNHATESGLKTLLDGDFLEFTKGRPMPLTDRAKAVFQMSILNDTLFLSIINVLDYSILIGIDEDSMELVVGIIDFMRQYDILKQMERVGKSLPMVVGHEAPTIIQPPLYKARFTNAMERYFMTVPSKWTTI